MRYTHEGMTLWTGTQDAPAPGDTVSAGAPISIMIGVQPANASNQVEVIYRVNEKPPKILPTNWIRNDLSGKTQYFKAALPIFQEGDTVEYTVFFRCAGHRIPPAAEAQKLTAFFDVTASTLKQPKPSKQKRQASPKSITAKTKTVIPKENIHNRVHDSSGHPRVFHNQSEHVAGIGTKSDSHLKPTSEKASISEDDSDIEVDNNVNSDSENVEAQIPFQFSSSDKKRLNCLKCSLSKDQPKAKLEGLFEKAKGDFSRINALMEEDEAFDKSSIRKLNFAHDLAELTEDNEELVSTFLANNKTHCLRDIALNVKKDEFNTLIKTKVPDDDNKEEAARNINDRLFRMAPAAVIHRMARDDELETDEPVRNGLLTFFDAHPELDFRKESILKTLEKPEALENIPEAQRDKIVHSLKCCQRLASICPTAEAVPKLMNVGLDSAYAINEVPHERFVKLYSDTLGGEDVAKRIHAQAQNINVRNEHSLIALRDAVLSPSVNSVHGGQSVDARRAVAVQIALPKDIPINFETLFGNVDLCECKHCNSVYSPAAYLVELFQYCRNNFLDPDNTKTGVDGIKGTPLKKLFRRRPDLGKLELTCENTNTLIPYIDLVNEAMEGYVGNLDDYERDNHDPKQAKIAAHNVEDESSGELLAEPQHTHYKAYRILKNAVYPVCKLPYYQPVDATRQYLNFLGTSRYELFSAFRKDISFDPKENATDAEIERLARMEELKNQAVDRGIAAEYLQLIEEEYVILTKEGFHSKEWYELKQQENLTLAQYHDKIGLKETWAYYGIDNENAMLEELKWVKPVQEAGIVGFLRRTNMQYVDLIELLKTRYINPNYPSGKALAFMNSLPYSYRFLQTLVNEGQAKIQAKYQQLINFLQTNLNSYAGKRFDMKYVACWVYTYFEKIGELIVLEDASSCKCLEGTLQLEVVYRGESVFSILYLYLDAVCQVYMLKEGAKQYVGHLDTLTGRLVLDQNLLNINQIILGLFTGLNGESGQLNVEDMILHINGQLFICTDYQENCDISKTQLQHLDGTNLVTTEYDRMHRFIRLWCKLDWSIDEVDQAITGVGETINIPPTGIVNFSASTFITFQPTFPTDDENDLEFQDNLKNSNPALSTRNSASTRLSIIVPEDDPDPFDETIAVNPPDGDPKPGIDDLVFEPLVVDPADCTPELGDLEVYEITPYLIDQLAAVKELQIITGLNLDKLLTFWTSIGIAGEKPLYQQLFLKYNQIAEDDIFQADDFETYLTKEKEKINGKEKPVTISNHLPALIAAFKVDVFILEKVMSYAGIDGILTLPNVSHIYRHILLAKALGLRIKQLPALFELTKEQAHPFSQPSNTLKFYKLFQRIEDSGFVTRELNYLIRNEDDEDKPLRPSDLKLFRLAISLRNALLEIDIDDEEATEELLREKMSLLFDGSVVEQIIGLVQGSTVYEDNTRRKYSATLPESDQQTISTFFLEARKSAAENPDDPMQTFLRKVQFSGVKGLQITGILSDSDQDRLRELGDLISDGDERERFIIAVDKILSQPGLFFEDALATIFPDKDTTEEAKAILLAEDTLDDTGGELSAIEKRVFLTKAFLCYLREQLRQRQILQILASELGIEPDLTAKLVMELIKTQDEETIYQEIIRLREQKDPGVEDQDQPFEWKGFFVPEKEGTYTFLLEAESEEASLTFENRALWKNGPVRTDEELINFYQSKALFLKAGQTYSFHLQGYDEDESGKIIGLFFKFYDRPQTEITDKHLFPALRTENFITAYIQLHKAALLLDGLAMTLEEMELFLEFPDSFQGLDFNTLSFPQWLQLEAFYRLKKELRAKALSLVEFLRWSNKTIDTDSIPTLTTQITRLTGWEETEVDKFLKPKHFNLSHPEHFRNEQNLLKLQKTLKVVHQIGLDIDQLFKWGEPPNDFGQAKKISGAIREAIRARYQQDEWEEAIKDVHNQRRENQKQALIAYLLAQPVLLEWGVRDADSLFEFFLIDVQMDACMETSRIKQAISSVQLFVQRCFLGLEEKHGVRPDVLDRQRWEWMSRYRVWEANRKVFLYPENWIEPGLRDDKSPFFEEQESELLQNDISQEMVKSALTKYIVQVDEVANLEIVGVFVEGDTRIGKLHVIGRTRNSPFFFYYRYYEFDNEYWYPWEKVEVDIPSINVKNNMGMQINNGIYVTPLVWKDRLFIFFPEFTKKNWNSPLKDEQTVADSAQQNSSGDMASLHYWEIRMGVSERKEGKWLPKSISNHAIDAIKIRDDLGFSGHWFDLYLEPDKFIFSPYVNDESENVRFQPSYVGQTSRYHEHLYTEDEGKKFVREPFTSDDVVNLDNSFRFNGSELRVGSRVTNIRSSFMSSIPYQFHQRISSNDNIPYLLPIQSKSTTELAVKLMGPVFYEVNDKYHITSSTMNYPFFHPTTGEILRYLRKDQIVNVFDKSVPLHNDNYGSKNGNQYHELKRPYSLYNWEALFHSAGLLADNLSKSQRFEESRAWWHYIFDPINVKDDIKKVWKFLPFRATDSKNVLEQIFNQLDPNTPNEDITEWRDNPFMPHVIARSRPSAYMKLVVMKYIDNLIAWGDSLFRQDTIESLNQATQLYIMAGHILGPRPEIIPKRGKIQPKSYMNLVDEWDASSNAMVDLELIFPFSNQIATQTIGDDEPHYINIYGFATTLYFCIPDNPKLLEYWDTVADRLFKIRHCLNIEGIFRKLNLFEPPIDPALLVQAAAQGLSIGSVLNDLSTPMPNYRFNYLLARASEVVSEVKSLGNALLAALEKKDGESVSLLRSRHETNIQTLVMEVRNKQLEEAQKTKESLEENRKAPVHRLEHYQELVGEEDSVPAENAEYSLIENDLSGVDKDSSLKLIAEEKEEIEKAKQSRDLQIGVGVVETLAGILHLFPTVDADVKPIGIGIGTSYSGQHLGMAIEAVAKGLQIGVNVTSAQSAAASRKANFKRQLPDRILQANLAGLEIKQIDKQITTQEIRIELADLEICNHQKQIDQTKEVEEFIRSKFSNEQLYIILPKN